VPLPLIFLTARPAGIIYLLQLAAFIVAALVLSLPQSLLATADEVIE